MGTNATDRADRGFVHVDRLDGPIEDTDPPGTMHSHANIHQVCCLEAGGGELVLDDETREVSAPTLLHLPPGVSHRLHLRPGSGGYAVSFTDSLLPSDREPDRRAFVISLGDDTRTQTSIRELCARLHHEFVQEERGHRRVIEACLDLLMIEIERISLNPENGTQLLFDRARSNVNRYRVLIEKEFRTGRNLPEYVAELGTTVDSLNEHCKLVTGKTAGQVLRDRMLSEAKRTLLLSGLPVGEIALRLGFSDASYFVRFFKKATGQTPQQYRRTFVDG